MTIPSKSERRKLVRRMIIRAELATIKVENTRLREVAELLGIRMSHQHCSECNTATLIHGHQQTCPLRKIRPGLIRDAIDEAQAEVRKKVNRQLIYHGEVKRFGGGPAPMETACRRKRLPKRDTRHELQHCYVCGVNRLFKSGVCTTCQHHKPCDFNKGGPNCKTCF